MDDVALRVTRLTTDFLDFNGVDYDVGMKEIHSFMTGIADGRPIAVVAHNLNYDLEVIQENDTRHELGEFSFMHYVQFGIDTLEMSKCSQFSKHFKKKPVNNTLDSIYPASTGKPRSKNAHDAEQDVRDLEEAFYTDKVVEFDKFASYLMTPIGRRKKVVEYDTSKRIRLNNMFTSRLIDIESFNVCEKSFFHIWQQYNQTESQASAVDRLPGAVSPDTMVDDENDADLSSFISSRQSERIVSLEAELAAARAELDACNQKYSRLQDLFLKKQGQCIKLANKVLKMRDEKKRKKRKT